VIIRASAIPLACFPYSSSSRIVHWLTRHRGKVSTLLKGAMRPKSPFLGGYELFFTSELLYYEKRVNTLHAGKECAILHRRDRFRTDWRAMQTASYLAAVIDRTTPEEAPLPELFELFELLLDLAEEHGRHSTFLIWSELKVCAHHGHAPRFTRCILCGAQSTLRLCASEGGTVCVECSRSRRLPVIECTPDVPAILHRWQQADLPSGVAKTRLSDHQSAIINTFMENFMMYQFGTAPDSRRTAIATLAL
jgi:DNA repair protein RecO (recombination protein O)